MIFERPMLLWLAPILAAAFWALAAWARSRRIHAAAAWSPALAGEAARLGRKSPMVLGVAALLVGVAIAGPRWGLASRQAESRALNVVFVMDISRSMLATDAAPDRLTRSISTARRLVQDLSGDRLALIAFAARPYLLSPLTLDQSALALQLDALDPTVASEGGSALGAALTMAGEVLAAASEGGDRVVVVFTDGEAFDGESAIRSAAGSLESDDVTLVMVPVGKPEGARIPSPEGGWHLDAQGNEVLTSRRDDLIAAAVDAGEAVLISPDLPDPAGEVRRALQGLDRATVRDRMAADLVPRAWLFALGALILIGWQALSRRTAALIAVALCTMTLSASAQRPTAGTVLLNHGDTLGAGRAFLDEAKRVGSDTAWYNAGTAALVQGDLATAAAALERATASLDPDLRRKALYNLGTLMLVQSKRDTAATDSLLTTARRHLREALQLSPGDMATKYNYELATRLQPPPPPPSSGGGGDDDQREGSPPPTDQPSGARNGMTQAEAEQVLNAMERAERSTRQEMARRQRRSSQSSGPDW